jgi:hypothetical protein
MGLLDDAIREHLELKRKHGADPADVARQEQEALGEGPRNEFAQPPAPEPEAAPPAAVAAEAAAPVQQPEADELPEGEPELVEEPAAAEPAPAEPPVSSTAGAVPASSRDVDPWLDERDEVPADESLQPPRTGEEDVLEETPDFLQETPEHDRLWFEQKPPRDFDFD